jgi:triosephosphate isomerase
MGKPSKLPKSPKLIAANWKEHPKTEAEALSLFRAVAKAPRAGGMTVVVAPPFLYLEEVIREFNRMTPPARLRLAIAAQDVFWEEQGAYTGEVGPAMLRSLGAKYVIVGHSERRRFEKETDAMINKKIALALKDGLKVILCVGESLSVREKGAEIAKKFVAQQLAKDFKDISPKAGSLLVAYEPIWAIGTGRSDKPEDARDMAMFIKKVLKQTKRMSVKFLYGGSVNGKNIGDYVQLREIDGALVGGASLKAEEFKKIINAI